MEDQIKVTTFAPVFIPTLNRSDHFIKLIESLERCTWAEFTEVFVSLDYPPSEKYEEGHRIIDLYLLEKEKKNGFKQLYVFRQSHNLGIKGNFTFLDHYRQKYDRFIISEDDNIFSPNFLVFMNKGLEKYKNDSSVYSINGYTLPYDFRFGDNTFFKFNNDFCGWGCGLWSSKWDSVKKEIDSSGFRKTWSFKKTIKVYHRGFAHLRSYFLFCLSRHPETFSRNDTALSVYMIINNLCVICPSLSTVRNEGWDNTGNSTNYVANKFNNEELAFFSARHLNQQIDDSSTFNFEGDPMNFFDYNNQLAVRESSERISCKEFVVSLLSFVVSFIRKTIKGHK